MKKAYRQGELIFIARESKVELKSETKFYGGATVKENNIIREGEVTGHCHEIKDGRILELYTDMILDIPKGTQVVHPEHKPLNLPKPPEEQMDIIIQREYDEDKDRNVMD